MNGQADQHERGDQQHARADGDDITGMSGGWTRAFTLDAPAVVALSLRYELNHAEAHEPDEVVQAPSADCFQQRLPKD